MAEIICSNIGNPFKGKEEWHPIEIKVDPSIEYVRFTTEEVGHVLNTIYANKIDFAWGWQWDCDMEEFMINHYTTDWYFMNRPPLEESHIMPDNILPYEEPSWFDSGLAISHICFVIANLYKDSSFTSWYKSFKSERQFAYMLSDSFDDFDPYTLQLPRKTESFDFINFSTEEVGHVLNSIYGAEVHFALGWLCSKGIFEFMIYNYMSEWSGMKQPSLEVFTDNVTLPILISASNSAIAVSRIAYIAAALLPQHDYWKWYSTFNQHEEFLCIIYDYEKGHKGLHEAWKKPVTRPKRVKQ
jgi:hypothetical protein